MDAPRLHYRRDWLDVAWFALLILAGIGAVVLDLTVGFESLAGLVF